MSKVFTSVLTTVALVIALAGCQKKDETGVTSDASRLQSTANPAPAAQTTRDPSLPDAASALAKDKASDQAKTIQDSTALQRTPAPQKEMTKQEESMAMPLPSQANDHSTTALDKNKGQ